MLNGMCDSAPIEAAELLGTLGVTRAETAPAERRLRRAPLRRLDDVTRCFVRRGEFPRPPTESVAAVRPWSCTYDEFVGHRHIHYVDGLRSIRDIDAFVAPDPEETGLTDLEVGPELWRRAFATR
ncbi:hypothetical protein [Nocardia sp. MH4]|uniref:hypothetical protein n=1 Tax=Nocardia sp. MH4 TaxID=1768677 RepID=UPI001C4E8E3F|nr:hypothetical protein [Nocardia sp. MH4]